MSLSADRRAAFVEAIVFDVDGVLTRGDIIYASEGEWKTFNVQDGMGFDLARQAGLKLAMFSGRASTAVRRRAKELHVHALAEGVKDKGTAIAELLEKLGVKPEQVCYVGDDLIDLPAMDVVGFPVAVANAVEEVRSAAAWVTKKRGGEGAAREVIEFVLKAKGLWSKVVQRYSRKSDE
jgi:3-deoxy-D-manno-octulosonate 8-phosphate phosphatase (KDO 8-P phosphatase)